MKPNDDKPEKSNEVTAAGIAAIFIFVGCVIVLILLAVGCTSPAPDRFEVLRDAQIEQQGDSGILVTASIKNNGVLTRGEMRVGFYDQDGELLFTYIDDKTPTWAHSEVWAVEIAMDADLLRTIVEQSRGIPYPRPADGYVASVRLVEVSDLNG